MPWVHRSHTGATATQQSIQSIAMEVVGVCVCVCSHVRWFFHGSRCHRYWWWWRLNEMVWLRSLAGCRQRKSSSMGMYRCSQRKLRLNKRMKKNAHMRWMPTYLLVATATIDIFFFESLIQCHIFRSKPSPPGISLTLYLTISLSHMHIQKFVYSPTSMHG